MPRLFLLDAYALIFRAYYAFIGRPMRSHTGLNTSPIFGFTKFLRDIIVREKPHHLGVAFDPKGGNFRHKLYPAYKANRAETPEDIILAVPYIKAILAAMRIPILEVPGWEADDVIGTLSVEATAQGFDTYMVTPDKDYGQLVTEHARIYKQRKSGPGVDIVDVAAIKAQYGIEDPRQVADVLALWGDASDNVPGVPGIGEKGAMKLVAQFGSVENVLAAAERGRDAGSVSGSVSAGGRARSGPDSVVGKGNPGPDSGSGGIGAKMRENILSTRDQLLLSKRLVTIDTAVPIDFVPAELEMCDPDCPALRKIYEELDFTMFLREMATDSRSPFNSAILCRGTIPAGRSIGADVSMGPGTSGGSAVADDLPGFGATGGVADSMREGSAFGQERDISAARHLVGRRPDVRKGRARETQPSLFDQPEVQESAPDADITSERGSGLPPDGVPDGEFRPETSVAEQMAPAGLSDIEREEHDYRTIETEDGLRELVAGFEALPEFAIDTETTGYDCFTGRMVGISLCAEPGKAFWIPLEGGAKIARSSSEPGIPLEGVEKVAMRNDGATGPGFAIYGPAAEAKLAVLRPLLENEKIAKIGQNIKFDEHFLRSAGIVLRGRRFDTMVIHYLLDPESRHNMNHLSHNYLHYDPIQISSLIGSGAKQVSMDMVPPAKIAEYAAEDADVTLRLKDALWPMVGEQGLAGLYLDIEEPLIEVLGAMEREGVRIDTAILDEYAGELRTRLDSLEEQIREQTGERGLNVNSARQLGEVLFGKLQIGGAKPKMTKTRQFSTDEETLQGLTGKHPAVGLVLEYRGVKKLLSTYVEALPQLINPRTGRIHTSYNQAVTATGRLSSTGPNLQNIPIREEQGRKIRQAFVPSDGDHLLLSADYSQVELRLMAHLSGDPALIGAFEAGEDIHRATAAKIFGVPLDEVTQEQRRRAKTANFGIIYGISAFGLSQRLGIGRTEAAEIIDGYFRSYPGVKAYMEKVVADARTDGYVSTIFGRRRFLADINSHNAVARSLAERNAINAPIQGSAADIMKIAMIRIFAGLREQGLRSKMILQVHDEVVIDMVRGERAAVEKLVVEAMEGAAKLAVELKVDFGVGENWLDAH